MEQNIQVSGLNEAKRAAGGASAIARIVNVTPQAVAQWRAVPPEHVLKIEKATGVSRHVQRPDVFGPADDFEATR